MTNKFLLNNLKIIIPIAVIFFVIAIIAFLSWDKNSELVQRLTLTKNTGVVTAVCNGNSIDLNGFSVERGIINEEDNSLSSVTSTKIKNGKFHFADGLYGDNFYKIIISTDKIDGYANDIILYLTIVNSNKWQVILYDINVDIITIGGEAHATVSTHVQLGKEYFETHSEAALNDTDNAIRLFIGSDI